MGTCAHVCLDPPVLPTLSSLPLHLTRLKLKKGFSWHRVLGPFLIGRLADAAGGSYAVPMAALAAMDLVAAGLLIGEHIASTVCGDGR